MVIRDEIALGTVSGLLATVPQLIFDLISFKLSYTKHFAFQISGSIFMHPALTARPLGILLGGFVWESAAAVLGIFVVLLIKYTGKDFWWLKGLLVSTSLMYTIVYGLLLTLGAARIVPFDIPTNITVFIGNIIFGISSGYFAKRFGPW